jgi:large subunit ribosomal protein L3
MGAEMVTVKGLEVVDVDVERNLLMIKGGVPGANGELVIVVGR